MPTAISQGVLDRFSNSIFRNSAGIDAFFGGLAGEHYIRWFNSRLANQGVWQGIKLIDTDGNLVLWRMFWDQIPSIYAGALTDGGISLIQFLALMGIISNETRGGFFPVTEGVGGDKSEHPGLAFPFDKIPGVKGSYNTLPGNRTAFDCFREPGFIARHGHLPPSGLIRTSDTRWKGDVYPTGVPTGARLEVTGFIMQADFMKFRGRGLIQTTGRANYSKLIQFVQAYSGSNAAIVAFKQQWADRGVDQVAFETSNDDWDRLFQNSDLQIPCVAIRLHNTANSNYLRLPSDAAILNGATGTQGSLRRMGLKISGSPDKAQRFFERVAAVLQALPAPSAEREAVRKPVRSRAVRATTRSRQKAS